MNALHNAKLTIAVFVLYPFHLLRYFLVSASRQMSFKREARKMRSTFQRPLYRYEESYLKMRHNAR